MTPLKEILNIAVPKIPLELQEEAKQDESYAYTGCIDMIVALNLDADVIFEDEEVIENGKLSTVSHGYCTIDLTISQKWLAALYTYKVYLERLKIEKSVEAINFSTLTFSIKGLEKIPENKKLIKQMVLMQYLEIFTSMDKIVSKKQELYKQTIDLLKYIEFVIGNTEQYKVIRKQVLDLANAILRMDD